MKKYIIICATIFVGIISLYYLSYNTSFYISIFKKNIKVDFMISDKNILYKNKIIKLNGVNISSSIPGYKSSDYAINKETYLRWFQQISEMNANVIRISTIYNPEFYEALYKFNKDNSNPLFLLQEIQIDDYLQNSKRDAFNRDIMRKLKYDIKTTIDVVHGHRNISKNSSYASGNYRYDVSNYIIGYLIGGEFRPDLIAYTNELNVGKTFNGKYFKTKEKAHPFEAFLAELGEELIKYESNKYGVQKLVSFEGTPEIDPLNYSEDVMDYFNKYVDVDLEHIEVTNKVLSGLFASYIAYEGYPDYLKLSEEEIDDTYLSYLESLNEHHTIPVVIVSFGYSTARGTSNKDISSDPLFSITETKQASYLENAINRITKSGCVGMFINEWADSWDKNTWNTVHSINIEQASYWSNTQSADQGYGLLATDPGKEKIYPDGNKNEWSNDDLLLENNEFILSTKYDEKYLYLLVEKNNQTNNILDNKIYIPLDITNKSGARRVDGIDNISFNRDTDFLIVIDNKDNSQLYVQERYDVLRAIYLRKIERIDPYEFSPNRDSTKFDEVRLITNTQYFERVDNSYVLVNMAKTINTGKLTYGNASPEAVDYNSLSDYYATNDFIEIRIAWNLLNFSDPSEMMIHDDYYEHYGVEDINIKNIFIGVGTNGEINLSKVTLNGWGKNITYRERLKPAYYHIQKLWGGLVG